MEKARVIRIMGDNSLILSVKLEDMLDCLNRPVNILWTLLWIEATVKPESTLKILDFEQGVKESPNGLTLTWDELVDLAVSINQTLELLLIGGDGAGHAKRYKDDDEMYAKCRYTIELIDSSYWEVRSFDLDFIERAKSKFEGVENIKPDEC